MFFMSYYYESMRQVGMKQPQLSPLSLMGLLNSRKNVSWGTASDGVAIMNIWSDGLATIAPKICGCLSLNYVAHRMFS